MNVLYISILEAEALTADDWKEYEKDYIQFYVTTDNRVEL